MQNLVLDIGNTRVKLALFENNKIKEVRLFDKIQTEDIQGIIEEFGKIDKCILSSVRERDEEIINYLQQHFSYFIEFTGNTPFPFKNEYESKNTQGPDRIAAVAGALDIFPGKNVLVIDAGTTITYEFLSSEGIYKGGNISPGINMRLKSLNTFTKKLPLVNKRDSNGLLGLNTQDAILLGVLNGVAFEAEGYLESLKKKYNDIKVVVTGGDSGFYASRFKEGIIVELDLVLNGLNRILEYNALH